MKATVVNPEVFYADGDIVSIAKGDLQFLHDAAERSPRRRARVCAHKDVDETLHEMVVVLKRDSYLIPEKHFVKVESYHIIEGTADVVIFDDAGQIVDVIPIGDASTARPYFFRVRHSDFYHSLIVRSDFLLYHESATGPFRKSDTLVAPWAPAEADVAAKNAFMGAIEQRADRFLAERVKAVAAE